MPETPSARLVALRPAIKSRWAELLKTKPASPAATTPLVIPAMLVFMLDDTLARLERQLAATVTSDRLRRDLAPYGAMRAGCQCGLHLLLDYYLAGAQTLQELLPAECGLVRVEVIHGFNRMAHDEMATLCGVCRYRGGALCGLRPDPATPRK